MISCLIAVGLLISIASEAYDAEADRRIRESISNVLFCSIAAICNGVKYFDIFSINSLEFIMSEDLSIILSNW